LRALCLGVNLIGFMIDRLRCLMLAPVLRFLIFGESHSFDMNGVSDGLMQ
jgi:hypothetical protein